MLHVVTVTVVYAVFQIARATTVEGAANVVEVVLREPRVQSVNLNLQTDESILGIILMAQRLLDGLHSRSRRAEHGRTAFSLGVLRNEQIAVHAVALVCIELYEPAVNLVGAVFLCQFTGVLQRLAVHVCYSIVPELPEVGRLFGVRAYLLWRETNLYVVLVGLSVNVY